MAKRRRGRPARTATIAFDLNKIDHEIRMLMLQFGMEILEELAERVAEEANILSMSITDDWDYLPGQKRRRGPNKSGGSDSGPIAGSVFARPSKTVPTSWLVVAPAWYSHFIEYGTDPHDVIPSGSKRGHDMSFLGTNKYEGIPITTKKVEHPGIKKAQPFLRPAGDKADNIIKEILRERGLPVSP